MNAKKKKKQKTPRDKTKMEIKVSDPNAKAMWGRCRHQVFKDKTKYSRKTKHKGAGAEDPGRED